MKLEYAPIRLAEANAFVQRHHRHHGPVTGCKFCVSIRDAATGELRGVAIVGRPVARALDDGVTLEVNRLCTLGDRNACSMLYAAAWRAAKAMGYTRLITYTLPQEGGASLRAAGWRVVARTKGGSWNCPSRPREDDHPLQAKLRWEAA